MKQYNKTTLKRLQQSLEFGDIKRCADDLQVSTTTVQTALKGQAITPASRAVLEHLEFMVEQARIRRQRIAEAKTETA